MTTDILFDPATGDLLIKNGDLVVGDSTDQHTYDLITAEKGHYKFVPLRGVGLINFLNDVDALPNLAALIRSELQADGQNVQAVNLQTNPTIQVQSSYPS